MKNLILAFIRIDFLNLILLTITFTILTSTKINSQNYFPEWAKGIIWYQIFPERFSNGDVTNDPTAEKVFINDRIKQEGWAITPWTSDWFEFSFGEKKLGGKFRDHLFQRRYGGDLQGVINKLDYLKELGIGAIYFNPIFEAVSLHKYDGSTFHHIDVNFGPDPEGDKKLIATENPEDPTTWVWTSADKLFLKLLKEARARNIRVIIDGVFNHTGVQFWAFQDIVKHGKKSKYYDWFIIKSLDNPETEANEFDYKAWWNFKSLPEFNRTKDDLHEGVKKYAFDITRRWMDPNGDGDPSDGIDGWRLDVARDVPLGFWRDWNKLVKSINPEAIIVGELWEISSDFISESGVFDALMNYNFAFAVNNFFIADETKIATTEFIKKLKEIDNSYPQKNLYLLQNLISSHDTDRLVSMIKNPDRRFDYNADERNINYDPSKPTQEEYQKQKLIAAFQFTYRGAPMIYYGDEVGMWGADDPHVRKPMVWNELVYEDEVITELSQFQKGHGRYTVEVNQDLLNFYKKIISIRNNNEALVLGDVNFIYQNDRNNCFAFIRTYNDKRVLVLFNNDSNQHRIEVEFFTNGMVNLLTNEVLNHDRDSFKVTLKPYSFQIYELK